MNKTNDLLIQVVERYLFHQSACRSKNPFARELAAKMCEIEIAEMWLLTQL